IHGATFASEDITESSAEKLPSVQVGDPFTEKLLLEATLEAISSGAVVAIQDMGAAGITCSSSEMSAKGGVGMDLWLDKVPTRQPNMQPFEILLSESQERMLVIAEKGKEEIIYQIFEKWDLPCSQIGIVTDSPMVRYYFHGELVGEVPAESLVLGGGAPVYEREIREPTYLQELDNFDQTKLPEPTSLQEIAKFLVQQPDICSRRWISEQYDSMVGVGTMTAGRTAAAPVVHIKGTDLALALSTDCNGRLVKYNPFHGTATAVLEAARNVACAGGKPIGITNCLNFGNPYNPEVYWQFSQAILGMKAACEALQIPVTGGNVSFYNQSPDGPVFPTPTIGMVGLIESASRGFMTSAFSQENLLIYLLGKPSSHLGNSTYVYRWHRIEHSPTPEVNFQEEVSNIQFVLYLIENKLITAANDVSDGGLLIALIESAVQGGYGFSVQNPTNYRKDEFWFSEAGGRLVIAIAPEQERILVDSAKQFSVPILKLGTTGGQKIWVDTEFIGSVQELAKLSESVLPTFMEK
ncbi:MAG: AIR synthase-related protein, partial [Bacteroidia bacterium]|nr:AIR synthase-related protein [Bacteroidia bacterium]